MNVIKESFKYAKKYTPAWITVILLGFLCVTAGLLIPQASELLIDRVINPILGEEVKLNSNLLSSFIDGFAADDYWGIFLTLVAILGVFFFVRYVGHYIRWNVAHFYGVRCELDFRMAAFSKMLDQNSLVMARYTSGDLMSICNSDNITLKDVWSHYFSLFLDQFIAIGLAVVLLLQISWQLMLLPLFLGLVLAVAMVFYTRALRRCYNRIREASVALNSCVQENINGVRIIRSYASEETEIKKFKNRNENYRDSFLSQSKVAARYGVIFSTINQSMVLCANIIGVILAVGGKMTAGQFLTFGTYMFTITNAMIIFSNYMGAFQNAMICGNRLFTFINTSNSICDPAEPKKMPEKPDLSMRNVSIKLDEKEELRDVTIDIPYGKKLGIMGKTGSGKSVMIKALTRLFETTIGETCINGINIKNYRVEDVRRQFGYVMQEVFLFSNTVDANIAYYDPDAPREEVVKAAKVAQADGFINKLADGYETIVGEKGLGLSGGQKQRISIARALLKNAPVILLDDCTSSLDLETERRILSGLSENYHDRTLIIASHRAASVVGCDEILYLENGQIVERGNHAELMEKKGRYYDVFTSQASAMQEALS